MNINIYKIRKDAKLPVRAHPTDAGMDLFYCPDPSVNSSCIWEENGKKYFRIPPGENCLIPTGLKVEAPKDHMLEIKNKSGIASKKQLIVGACVVDPGYTGELYVNLHNIGRSTIVIEPGQKIAQAVLIPVVTYNVNEVDYDLANKETSRGSGGFGSTGQW